MVKDPLRRTDTRVEEFAYSEEEIACLNGQAKQMNVVYTRAETKEGASQIYEERVKIGLSRLERGNKGIDLNPADIVFSTRCGNYREIKDETVRGKGPEAVGVERNTLLTLLRGTLPFYVVKNIPLPQ